MALVPSIFCFLSVALAPAWGVEASRGTAASGGPPASACATPADLLERLTLASRRGDLRGFLSLFESASLRGFEELILQQVRLRAEKEGVRQALLGFDVESIDALDALPAAEVIARAIGSWAAEIPELREHLVPRDLSAIGTVPEGPDLLHYVVRATVLSLPVISVISMKRTGDGWLLIPTMELRSLVEELQRLFEIGLNRSRGAPTISEATLPPSPTQRPPAPSDKASLGATFGGTPELDPNTGLPTREPIAVVGNVVAPKLIKKVQPIYPEEARLARVQGRVIAQAVIDEEGAVRDVSLLRGVTSVASMVDDAAMDAVRQWRYEPATLEGRPVKVYFTVVVSFTLTN